MISPCRVEVLPAPTRTRGAFTLVELLVSVTVAALLLGLLVSVMARALQMSQTSADTLAAYSSAATAMDLVATDLASLAVTRQPFEYLQARPESSPGLTSIPTPNVQPMRLMMLITSPEDSAQPSPTASPTPGLAYPDSGQVHAVSYLMAWQNPVSTTAGSNPGNSVFGIYRQVATAADTFKYVLGTTDLYNAMYVSGNVGSMQTPPALSAFVIGNVVDFQLAFYANPISTATGNGSPAVGSLLQPPVFINSASASASTALPYLKTQLQGTQTLVNGNAPAVSYGPVVYAEISLTVIEQPGAKLWGDGTGVGARSPAAIRQKFGHTLTRKVVLRTPE